MEKSFEPAQIESKWYERWEASGAFQPSGQGEPYCILLPPPNVTGTLHMGHAFQQTLMDTLVRYQRMRGQNTSVAGRHRPRRHRHPEDRREPAGGRGQDPPRPGPRSLHRTRVGVEGRVRFHHHPPDAPPRRFRRLVARALHHGRGPVRRRASGCSSVVPCGPAVSRQAPGALGPGAADGGLRPGSEQRGARRHPVADPLSGVRRRRRAWWSPPPGRRPCWATWRWRCIRKTNATRTSSARN